MHVRKVWEKREENVYIEKKKEKSALRLRYRIRFLPPIPFSSPGLSMCCPWICRLRTMMYTSNSVKNLTSSHRVAQYVVISRVFNALASHRTVILRSNLPTLPLTHRHYYIHSIRTHVRMHRVPCYRIQPSIPVTSDRDQSGTRYDRFRTANNISLPEIRWKGSRNASHSVPRVQKRWTNAMRYISCNQIGIKPRNSFSRLNAMKMKRVALLLSRGL